MKAYLLLNKNDVVIGRVIAANICDAASFFHNSVDDVQLLSDDDYMEDRRDKKC
jgi:hypothetical protein